MQDYQRAFIEFALRYRVLQFGQFTLKSGRVSPYFFNAGLFNDGEALAGLGQFYAQALQSSDLAFDVLYGPAYKGIPLATAVAIALASQHGRNVAYCFNRKEIKQHGEGGQFVGAPLQGRVVIVDDVMTAGTAIRESVELIETTQAKLQGVLIAFDRQEKGLSGQSAVQEVAAQYGVPVISIIRFTDLLAYVAVTGAYAELMPTMQAYRQQYGVS